MKPVTIVCGGASVLLSHGSLITRVSVSDTEVTVETIRDDEENSQVNEMTMEISHDDPAPDYVPRRVEYQPQSEG